MCSACTLANSNVPEGFEDVSSMENAPIEFYYNGTYLGSFFATFDDDFIEIESPKELVKEMVFVENPNELLSVLNKKLSSNSHLICHYIDKRKCKGLYPDKIGIILNRNKYQANLYINHIY